MPRKKRCRFIDQVPGSRIYKPAGVPARDLEIVYLELDEYEALRLADKDGRYHEEAANKMKISRQTFGRIIQSARMKVATAIIDGKGISFKIEDESIQLNKQ